MGGKAFCFAFTDTSVFKNVSTANAQCASVQPMHLDAKFLHVFEIIHIVNYFRKIKIKYEIQIVSNNKILHKTKNITI